MDRFFAQLILLILLAALPARSVFAVEPAAVPPASETAGKGAPELFQRVVILGASVSAGFTSAELFGGPKTESFRFDNFIEAALIGSHEPVVTRANRFLFTNAVGTMEKQIAVALADRPTLVVALDALFWFCYGTGLSSEQRVARFETGLKMMERFQTPLVVGDVPDASRAVGGILGQAEMPELAVITACNERLQAWAASRKNVVVFPLSDVMARAGENEALTLGGISWPKGKTRSLLQPDQLHPSRHGLAGLAIAALEMAAHCAGLPETAGSVRREPEVVRDAAIIFANARAAVKEAVAP